MTKAGVLALFAERDALLAVLEAHGIHRCSECGEHERPGERDGTGGIRGHHMGIDGRGGWIHLRCATQCMGKDGT